MIDVTNPSFVVDENLIICSNGILYAPDWSSPICMQCGIATCTPKKQNTLSKPNKLFFKQPSTLLLLNVSIYCYRSM